MFRLTKIYIEDLLHDVSIAINRVFSNVMAFVGLALVVIACVSAVLVWFQLRRVPDLNSLAYYHGGDSIQIFDCKDHLVCSVSLGGGRVIVPLSQIPKHVQLAVLAAEDHRFYEHSGLDIAGLIRALLTDLQAKRLQQGGSTVTQQLVKNLFFSDAKRSFDRKIAEMLVAVEIERHYSKDEIMSMYLNEIYFGNNANGIEQAALRYFGKDVGQLSLAEGAFLAGIIRAPSYFGAAERRQEGFVRQWQVLNAMQEYQYITPNQCELAKNTALSFKTVNFHMVDHPFNRYPYYVSFILDFLRTRFGETQKEGLRVYTNLDQTAQEAAERTLGRQIAHAPHGVTNEALISIAVKDAAIRAIVGGAHDYWSNQWNSATNPHTVGSSFKPFVYLAAFLEGVVSPRTIIEDSPIKIHLINGAAYSPQNFDHKFMGRITVREALAKSRNICAVRVAQMVGINKVVQTARLAGVQADLPPNLSLALGSAAISPLEMAGAYGCFARGGVAIRPWAIRRIEDRSGQPLVVYGPIIMRAFPDGPVGELVGILKDVVEYGTGTQAKLAGRPVAGKTGTADQARDIWFVGFTPDMVTAVWGGNDHNLPVVGHNVTGGSVMAQVWREYNRAYYAKNPIPPGHLLASDEGSYPQDKFAHQQVTKQAVKTNPDASEDTSLYQGAVRSNKGVTDYVWTRR